MAFADETPNNNKVISFGIVLIIHAFFAYLFISGLAVKAFKAVTGPIEILDVEEPPPPEEEPPPPPEKLEEIPPYVPPPEVNVDLPPPPSVAPPVTVQQTIVTPEPPRVVQTPPPPPPAPPKEPVRANIDQATFFKELKRKFTGDVPASVARQMEADGVDQDRVQCSVYVSESGAVTDSRCKAARYQKLEDEAKRSLRRFKFTPASEDGKPIGSWVDLPAAIVYKLVEG
jgi:periplasmic protein TonB